jgi:serine phosphatase RsbU (regulator of sigma subunit)/anti-sigma regulatory factor (Ser/Thr protein kinase)
MAMVRSRFPANPASVSDARRFVRDALRGWGATAATDDAVLLTSELVTNAVMHAGTPVEVVCQLADTAVQVDVVDGAPSRALPDTDRTMVGDDARTNGRGLLLPSKLAATWGVTYAAETKTVWFRLDMAAPDRQREPRALLASGRARRVDSQPVFDRIHPAVLPRPSFPNQPTPPIPSATPAGPLGLERSHRGWLGFLAEASDLLAGTLDEDMLVALSAQIVVPRLARWSAFYLAEPTGDHPGWPGRWRLAHVWHADEQRLNGLRRLLDQHETAGLDLDAAGARPWSPATGDAFAAADDTRSVVAVPLAARGRRLGVLVLGRATEAGDVSDVMWLVEDMGRRIALCLDNARMYSRQRAVSETLQRGLLPPETPTIPGVDHCVVYEPSGEGHDVGGDFYDIFQVGAVRWRFALGDVCGTGPEAAAVTGLARHTLRLLAREEYGVAAVLDRLNRALLDEGARSRLITVLYGELTLRPGGGAALTLASAGHPLPLLLSAAGEVTPAATPQLLLGAVPDVGYVEEKVILDDGDVLLCVTDGVTERRLDDRLLDDNDGLADLLAGCTGMTAAAVAARLRRAVKEYAPSPSKDDIAMLVMRAC